MDKKLARMLREIVGKENIITEKIALLTYGEYGDHTSKVIRKPSAVLFPSSTEIVAEIVKLANEHTIPLIIRGATTSLSENTLIRDGSWVLIFNKMNKILDINLLEKTALVEAGLVNEKLQGAIRKYDLMFPVIPASSRISTIGGNIAENAGGIRSVKYGFARDHVLALEIVLPSGEIIQTANLASKVVPYIDLTHLVCGSKGSLGIITKAKLALSPLNPFIETMTCSFDSIENTAKCVEEIIASGITPTVLEIIDNTAIGLVEDYGKLGLPKQAAILLLIEIETYPTEAHLMVNEIMRTFKIHQGYDYKLAKDNQEREELWLARELVDPAVNKLNLRNITLYTMVPRDSLIGTLQKISQLGENQEVMIVQSAQLGTGILQTRLLYDDKLIQTSQKGEKIYGWIIEEVISQGGNLLGESGVKIEKSEEIKKMLTVNNLEYLKKIKTAFDPEGLLNFNKDFIRGF